MICFVEFLTWWSWHRVVLPYLKRFRPRVCYVIDGHPFLLEHARGRARGLGVCLKRLQFQCHHVHTQDGLLQKLALTYFDLAEVQDQFMAESALQELKQQSSGHLMRYLAKAMVHGGIADYSTLGHVLFLIQVVRSRAHEQCIGNGHRTVLLLERRNWMGIIERYAQKNGVELVPYTGIQRLSWRDRLSSTMRRSSVIRARRILSWVTAQGQRSRPSERPGTPVLAIEQYAHFNVERPEQHSDLFFWQQSELKGSNILVTFGLPQVPLTDEKVAALRKHGITGVAMNRNARCSAAIPLYVADPWYKLQREVRCPRAFRSTQEGRWLHGQIAEYQGLCQYWQGFFLQKQVRIFVTWFKHSPQHCAMRQALGNLGGILAMYQRSYEELPTVGLTLSADIEFGFSPRHADVESSCGSIISYHVSVGYIGDHRFPLLRNIARRLRRRLESRGAERVVTFCDENTRDESRWHTGHELMRESYAFLLEKVISLPWFGLVIKPKSPATLRKRLGSVADLLVRAENTGRCYLYEGGEIQSSHPPALAALSSDVTIHEHVFAGTAAMESALAGVPTVMLDLVGWRASPLYRLGEGDVVFTDWESVWDACCAHWRRADPRSSFGDWTPLLDEIDPFRDGRAAERMGTYLHWLLEGLIAGRSRDSVMAEAAQRYCEIWGSDKVTSVNTQVHQADCSG